MRGRAFKWWRGARLGLGRSESGAGFAGYEADAPIDRPSSDGSNPRNDMASESVGDGAVLDHARTTANAASSGHAN